MLRIRDRILIKVAFTKSSEIPLLSKVGLKLNIQKTKIMAPGPITSWQIDGETLETVTSLFFWAPKSLQMLTTAMKFKDAYPWKELYDQPR